MTDLHILITCHGKSNIAPCVLRSSGIKWNQVESSGIKWNQVESSGIKTRSNKINTRSILTSQIQVYQRVVIANT